MEKYKIPRRKINEAVYLKYNPDGDPFFFREPKNFNEAKLFGLGLGLYWGEGTKANLDSVRLGNTDPRLIAKFMEFMERFFNLSRGDFKFGLQIFNDISVDEALDFWSKSLKIRKVQFYKPTITWLVRNGTYKRKSAYGVLTVMYHNKKLRNLLNGLLLKKPM
ncbi:MAG: hypothetical protein QMD50_02950 [Patescibacteria group bacterium]|nr:hypothetical protein [Patescibacteria group bacterium]